MLRILLNVVFAQILLQKHYLLKASRDKKKTLRSFGLPWLKFFFWK